MFKNRQYLDMELQTQNEMLTLEVRNLVAENKKLKKEQKRVNFKDIPNMISTQYNFEEFCNDCKNFDITASMETISNDGSNICSDIYVSCEHINTCRRMYDKFKKENKNNVDL